MNIESERAAFEAWYETTYGISLEPEFRANHFIGYVNDKANHRWTAWQARDALSAPSHGEQVREGWKLVPVEPTPEMLAAVTTSKHAALRAEVMRMAATDYRLMLAAAPHPVSGEQPYPEGVAEALERTDWTPEQALRWYAEGRHFDVVHGRTRIIDTGSVASNALKHATLEHLEMKGDAELHELRQSAQDVAGLVEALERLRDGSRAPAFTMTTAQIHRVAVEALAAYRDQQADQKEQRE